MVSPEKQIETHMPQHLFTKAGLFGIHFKQFGYIGDYQSYINIIYKLSNYGISFTKRLLVGIPGHSSNEKCANSPLLLNRTKSKEHQESMPPSMITILHYIKFLSRTNLHSM